jgi:hypothetical protein
MVSPLSLLGFAAALLLLASVVGRLRGERAGDSLADGCAATIGALAMLAAAVTLFGLVRPLVLAGLRFEPGSIALLASPIGATLALRRRGRRSIPRALLTSTGALAGVVLWLTLNLRGPRGDWALGQVALVLPAAAIAVASGACIGWWSKRGAVGDAGRVAVALLLLLPVYGCGSGSGSREPSGSLELTIRDAATGEPTPARVELLDRSGRAVVPDDALTVFSDCGSLPLDAWVPGFSAAQATGNGHRDVPNPYTGTTQFYADGGVRTRLAAGSYSVRATKGVEYRQAAATVAIAAGSVTSLDLGLERWIDLGSEGWYGADDHLHIPRPHPRFDARIATWMQAEGLDVANLLQMGLARDVHLTPQHGFGPPSVYRQGDTLILSGQENPRTHVLGHALVLGAQGFIDLPRQYLLYDRVWEEAHRQGGVNGYAHWGLAGAEEGLAVWGHDALLDFVEVLNLGFPFYERWYETLDLGLRIGPTAGTDYPCLPGLPGRERFYARVDGALGADSWLEAVRRGRTFVTNGPAIELWAEGAGPGEELPLAEPGAVRIRGRVRFDPERDALSVLELVRGGAVVAAAEPSGSAGEIRLDTVLEIDRTTWLALRATGEKLGETEIDPRGLFSSMLVLPRASNEDLLAGLPEGTVPRPSAAHSGAILVTVAGTPPLAAQPRGRDAARKWLARLDELERRLGKEPMKSWARFPGRGDGIDLETVQANRPALLQAIAAARRQLAEPRR